MRIVVNDIAASTGGAMTVLKDFYNCVCENDRDNEWIFLLADKYFAETENVKIIAMPEIKKSPVKKILFDFFTGKKFIGSLKPDVVFSMQNIVTFGLKVPQIVYVHQSLPFQRVKTFSFFKKKERKLAAMQHLVGKIIKVSAKKSVKVIVQTKWMKEAVCKECNLPDDKVVQIAPNVKNISKLRDNSLFNKNYFFYPTSATFYKNYKCIFDACHILKSDKIDCNVTLTLSKEYSTDNINCIGRIPYEDVIAHYNKSTLIFPSYIETFGYPLVEARMMGAIVLASDCPFCRENLAGYENAYFFDPFKPQELADLMKKVIMGEIKRKNSNESSAFDENSWKKVIETVCSVK